MSWTSCMEKKIEHHYGKEASECVKGAKESDLKKIAECIVNVVGEANMTTVLENLTKWSGECVF